MPNGVTYDFALNPNILSGAVVPPGTYQCMILYMSDLLTFVPATTAGNCVAGTTYQRVVASNISYTPATVGSDNILVYGSNKSVLATSSTDLTHAEKVLLYLSTASTGDGKTGLAFLRPTSGSWGNGITLNGAFTVSDAGASGTFVVNFNNQMDGGQNPCDLGPPVFSFR